MGAALGQFLHRFFMADKRIEPARQVGNQRIVPHNRTGDWAHRFAIPAFGHFGPQMMTQNANAIAAAHERHVAIRDLGHERQDVCLNARLNRIFGGGIVRDAARATTDDHARIVLKSQIGRQRFLIEADAMHFCFPQTTLIEKRREFAVAGVFLGAQLEDQKPFHAPVIRRLRQRRKPITCATCSRRSFCDTQRRTSDRQTKGGTMAGHSKWANIQHRKGRQDKVRAKLFSKLSKEITVAAKMGDPDPDKNPRLRLAVKEARSQSMPKDNIERAIKKASGGEGEDYEEIRYEGYGPNGVAVIVETMTDNRNRTASTVRSTFTKNGGNLGETGSVGFMFDRKGEVSYPADVGDADTVMMAAIEAGAEDVESSEDGHIIWCADTDLNEVATALEKELGESEHTKLVWKPTTTTELDLDGMQSLMRLVDALEDDDDVQRVTTNFEASDEVMAQLEDA